MTLPYKVWLGLRSGLFFVSYALITLFFSVTGIVFTWFLPFHIRGRYFVIGNALIIVCLRLFCGVRTRVVGELPAQQPYVALAKHQSQWETFYLQWFLFPVTTVVKKELLSVPFFGWALRMMNAIGIDRSNPRAAMRQTMEQGTRHLANDCNLLIFPEGTRVPHGVRGKYARGGAGIAVKAGVPILPIAHNAGRLWPPKSLLIRPGTVTLWIGGLIDTHDGDPKALAEQAAEWIEQHCDKMP
ncbi:lysophospholipid acyltransferase family protein [Spongiibacter marinus]|uniref:lysophospholipid acyltransferase family protein n=1 Tax=Spongiibacter marinus TaxID=354246 RepID=UPI0035679E7C